MKRGLLVLLLFAHVSTAVPQDAPPIQLAASTAEEEAAVTLPDPRAAVKLMWIGLGALVIGAFIAAGTVVSQCDDDSCGGLPPIGTAPTGTR